MVAALLACALFALQGSVSAPVPPAPPLPALSRIAVVGASASAGFNTCTTLAEALDLQIAAPHEPPKLLSEVTFFVEPRKHGEAQIARAKAWQPSLVVAPDFLFWFGYGVVDGEERRLELLETGLALLGELDCPLLVSRFPDMRPAIGGVLLAAQVPNLATVAKLNARVEQWAAARGRVGFVAMPEYIDKLHSGSLLQLGGLEIPGAEAKRRFLQPDLLHPTSEGVGGLARLCLEAACEPRIGAKPAEIRGELAAMLEALRKREAERAR